MTPKPIPSAEEAARSWLTDNVGRDWSDGQLDGPQVASLIAFLTARDAAIRAEVVEVGLAAVKAWNNCLTDDGDFTGVSLELASAMNALEDAIRALGKE
jgi:hypothetical protein